MSVRLAQTILNPAAHWRHESHPDAWRRSQYSCINRIDALVAAKLSLPDRRAAAGTLSFAETLINNGPAPANRAGAAEAI
jgi:hypothetical protein